MIYRDLTVSVLLFALATASPSPALSNESVSKSSLEDEIQETEKKVDELQETLTDLNRAVTDLGGAHSDTASDLPSSTPEPNLSIAEHRQLLLKKSENIINTLTDANKQLERMLNQGMTNPLAGICAPSKQDINLSLLATGMFTLNREEIFIQTSWQQIRGVRLPEKDWLTTRIPLGRVPNQTRKSQLIEGIRSSTPIAALAIPAQMARNYIRTVQEYSIDEFLKGNDESAARVFMNAKSHPTVLNRSGKSDQEEDHRFFLRKQSDGSAILDVCFRSKAGLQVWTRASYTRNTRWTQNLLDEARRGKVLLMNEKREFKALKPSLWDTQVSLANMRISGIGATQGETFINGFQPHVVLSVTFSEHELFPVMIEMIREALADLVLQRGVLGLDLMLVVDVSGSMDRYQEDLRKHFAPMIGGVRAAAIQINPRKSLRAGLVEFSDRGDYIVVGNKKVEACAVTAPMDEVTGDWEMLKNRLSTINTGFGGDSPEAQLDALLLTLNPKAGGWRIGNRSIPKVIITVSDTSSHPKSVFNPEVGFEGILKGMNQTDEEMIFIHLTVPRSM